MKKELQKVISVFALIALVSFGGAQVYAREQAYIMKVETKLADNLTISETYLAIYKDERIKAEQLQILSSKQVAEIAQQQVEQEAEAARLANEAKAMATAQTDAERKAATASAEAARVAAAKNAQAQAVIAQQKAAQAKADQLAQMQAQQRANELAAAKKSSRQSRAS